MRRVLSMLLISAGATVFAVAPASADPNPVALPMPITGQGYTDLRTPTKTLTGKDFPVGAWRDAENRYHSSKAYFTVDLQRLHGTRIFTAHAYSGETAVTDCTKPRSVELWQTKLAEQPTWLKAPRELTRFETNASAGCQSQLSWDITAAITKAVAAGQEKATFALRMAGGKQYDTGYGRRYAPLYVEVSANTPPSAATNPQIDAQPCTGTDHLVGAPPRLTATVSDPDPFPGFQVRYVVTDVADPAKRRETATYPNSPYLVPSDLIEHGHTYEWTAQGEDGYDRGQASTPCRFTADLRGPALAPAVTSDFAQVGAGFPGTFSFDARGDEDAVAFSYDVQGLTSGTVQADRPGGTATVTMRIPRTGPWRAEVRSVDRLGHLSDPTTYSFFVPGTYPTVTVPPGEAVLGSEVPASFRSTVPNVKEFVYEAGGVTNTVPAVDGAATVKLRITDPWVFRFTVRARTSAGELTEAASAQVNTVPSEPVITRDGDLYTFAPGMPGVVEYVYNINSGADTIVAAGPDGTVTLRLDLGERDFPPPSVSVRGRTSDGLTSRKATYYKVD